MRRHAGGDQVLGIARIYRRMFSVLALGVELVNLVGVDRKVALITNKYPTLVLLLSGSSLSASVILLQIFFPITLPLSEFWSLCFITFSRYVAFAFPLIHSMFHYRDMHFLWSKIGEITSFAFRELGYFVTFGYFWKRFLPAAAVCIVMTAMCTAIRMGFYSLRWSKGAQCCAILQQILILYIVLHTIFIVHMNSFFIRLLIKYIKVDYSNRASYFVFDHTERPLLKQLHLYKEIHYKLWEMTTAVNAFFGLTPLLLCGHSFVDIAYSAYYLYLNTARRDPVASLSTYKEIGDILLLDKF